MTIYENLDQKGCVSAVNTPCRCSCVSDHLLSYLLHLSLRHTFHQPARIHSRSWFEGWEGLVRSLIWLHHSLLWCPRLGILLITSACRCCEMIRALVSGIERACTLASIGNIASYRDRFLHQAMLINSANLMGGSSEPDGDRGFGRVHLEEGMPLDGAGTMTLFVADSGTESLAEFAQDEYVFEVSDVLRHETHRCAVQRNQLPASICIALFRGLEVGRTDTPILSYLLGVRGTRVCMIDIVTIACFRQSRVCFWACTLSNEWGIGDWRTMFLLELTSCSVLGQDFVRTSGLTTRWPMKCMKMPAMMSDLVLIGRCTPPCTRGHKAAKLMFNSMSVYSSPVPDSVLVVPYELHPSGLLRGQQQHNDLYIAG